MLFYIFQYLYSFMWLSVAVVLSIGLILYLVMGKIRIEDDTENSCVGPLAPFFLVYECECECECEGGDGCESCDGS